MAYGMVRYDAQVLPGQPTPVECVIEDWKSCHEGKVSYTLAIDSAGVLESLAFEPPRRPPFEACITDRLKNAVMAPALDCRFQAVPSVFRGGVTWSTSIGLSEAIPGSRGVIPSSPENCL